MSKILAFDTATDACTVAIFNDGIITEEFDFMARLHSQYLIPIIERLLNDAHLTINELDAIAFGCGPGSFTGVRIATSVAQGLAFAANLPVIPISTLAIVAQHAARINNLTKIIASIDARLNEVYWGAYEMINGHVKLMTNIMTEEKVSNPEHLTQVMANKVDSTWSGAGNGWRYYNRLNIGLAHYYSDIYPHAYDLVKLAAKEFQQGNFINSIDVVPSYVRNDVVK